MDQKTNTQNEKDMPGTASQANESEANLYRRFNQWLVKSSEKPESLRGTLLRFQPAAVELEAAPPTPYATAISRAIILLFVLAVVWACIGKIDIVAVATGQIVPSDRVKDVQAITLGKISAIHVREGDQVKAGDLLIELDETITLADLNQAKQEYRNLVTEREKTDQLEWFVRSDMSVESENSALKNYQLQLQNLSQSDQQYSDKSDTPDTASLKQAIHKYRADFYTLNQQLASRKAEARMVSTNVASAEKTLPIAKERLEKIESLVEKQFATRLELLEVTQAFIEQERQYESGKENYQVLVSQAAEIEAQLENLKLTRLAELAEQRGQLKSNIQALEQEITRASERKNQTQLTAPISGTITNLAMHTLGGVTEPAQVLMQIVPEDAQLEVEAWVENKDIGFVNAEQQAEIKVDSFQFTKYGVINGQINRLSEDAVNDEQRGPIYRALVGLEKDWVQVDNKQVKLTPGMSVSVEVKTGKRRIIEYFLKPIKQSVQESIRER